MLSLSPSALSRWQECRLRWSYERDPDVEPVTEVNSNLLRGSAGHAALESYYSVDPAGRTLELLLTNFDQAMSEAVDEIQKKIELAPWHEDDIYKATTQGRKALQQFWKVLGPQPAVPALKTEVRLSRMLEAATNYDEGMELHGILDGVWEQDDSVTIMEFKFPYSTPQLENYLQWSDQHRLYAWLLNTDKLIYVQYIFCTQNKLIVPDPYMVPNWAMNESITTAIVRAGEMESGAIYANYGFNCARCPYKQHCLARLTGGDV